MTGNMLDRNLIFPTCDYKQISKILPELMTYLKQLNSHPWPFGILPLCGVTLPWTHDQVPWAVPHPPTLVLWHAFLLPSCLLHTFDCLFGHTLTTPGGAFMSFRLPPWKRKHQSYCQVPSNIRSPTCKKIVILCSGSLSKQCILSQYTFLDYVTIQKRIFM